ncbi:MAG TPA: hypothetical protein VK943_04790 [Arenibaculum sp.]|nr:hypothetical protein [Arenibaculum sp.]
MAGRGTYDAALKDLLWSGAPALLAQVAGAPVSTFLAAEQANVRRRQPDMVARLDDGRLYHLELQAGDDRRMPWRMLEYYGLIAERNGGEPVFQQVLFVGPGMAAMAAGIEHPGLVLRYDVLDISTVDPASLLASPSIDDAVLAFLCRCDDFGERARRILDRAGRLDENERADVAARLLVLSGLRRATVQVMEEIKAMAIQVDIRTHPFLREVFGQGVVEGRAEGRAAMLIEVMEARFGPLDPALRERIAAADWPTLASWGRRVSTAGSVGEILDGDPPP